MHKLTPEQEHIQARARQFAEQEVAPLAREADEKTQGSRTRSMQNASAHIRTSAGRAAEAVSPVGSEDPAVRECPAPPDVLDYQCRSRSRPS